MIASVTECNNDLVNITDRNFHMGESSIQIQSISMEFSPTILNAKNKGKSKSHISSPPMRLPQNPNSEPKQIPQSKGLIIFKLGMKETTWSTSNQPMARENIDTNDFISSPEAEATLSP